MADPDPNEALKNAPGGDEAAQKAAAAEDIAKALGILAARKAGESLPPAVDAAAEEARIFKESLIGTVDLAFSYLEQIRDGTMEPTDADKLAGNDTKGKLFAALAGAAKERLDRAEQKLKTDIPADYPERDKLEGLLRVSREQLADFEKNPVIDAPPPAPGGPDLTEVIKNLKQANDHPLVPGVLAALDGRGPDEYFGLGEIINAVGKRRNVERILPALIKAGLVEQKSGMQEYRKKKGGAPAASPAPAGAPRFAFAGDMRVGFENFFKRGLGVGDVLVGKDGTRSTIVSVERSPNASNPGELVIDILDPASGGSRRVVSDFAVLLRDDSWIQAVEKYTPPAAKPFEIDGLQFKGDGEVAKLNGRSKLAAVKIIESIDAWTGATAPTLADLKNASGGLKQKLFDPLLEALIKDGVIAEIAGGRGYGKGPEHDGVIAAKKAAAAAAAKNPPPPPGPTITATPGKTPERREITSLSDSFGATGNSIAKLLNIHRDRGLAPEQAKELFVQLEKFLSVSTEVFESGLPIEDTARVAHEQLSNFVKKGSIADEKQIRGLMNQIDEAIKKAIAGYTFSIARPPEPPPAPVPTGPKPGSFMEMSAQAAEAEKQRLEMEKAIQSRDDGLESFGKPYPKPKAPVRPEPLVIRIENGEFKTTMAEAFVNDNFDAFFKEFDALEKTRLDVKIAELQKSIAEIEADPDHPDKERLEGRKRQLEAFIERQKLYGAEFDPATPEGQERFKAGLERYHAWREAIKTLSDETREKLKADLGMGPEIVDLAAFEGELRKLAIEDPRKLSQMVGMIDEYKRLEKEAQEKDAELQKLGGLDKLKEELAAIDIERQNTAIHQAAMQEAFKLVVAERNTLRVGIDPMEKLTFKDRFWGALGFGKIGDANRKLKNEYGIDLSVVDEQGEYAKSQAQTKALGKMVQESTAAFDTLNERYNQMKEKVDTIEAAQLEKDAITKQFRTLRYKVLVDTAGFKEAARLTAARVKEVALGMLERDSGPEGVKKAEERLAGIRKALDPNATLADYTDAGINEVVSTDPKESIVLQIDEALNKTVSEELRTSLEKARTGSIKVDKLRELVTQYSERGMQVIEKEFDTAISAAKTAGDDRTSRILQAIRFDLRNPPPPPPPVEAVPTKKKKKVKAAVAATP